MLGWEILVTRQDQTASDAKVGDGTLLARWVVGLGGIDWLDELVSADQATDLGGSGYPARWLVCAGMLRSIFRKGIAKSTDPLVIGDDYAMPSGWSQFETLEQQQLDLLDPTEALMVEAWDLS